MSKPVFAGLFTFKGRRSRKAYLIVLVAIFAAFFLVTAFVIPPVTTPPETGMMMQTATLVLCWVAGIFAGSQRFRDFGRSGWFAISFVVPIVGWLAAAAIIFVPGTRGPNRYGPDPLEPPVPNLD
jgi:uncharacterized membrane protein YhaH (DUF805 family)